MSNGQTMTNATFGSVVVGMVGGASAFAAIWLFSEVDLIPDYINAGDVGRYAIWGYATRLMLFSLLGAIWVIANREPSYIKAFQFGIAAPAALIAAALVLVSQMSNLAAEQKDNPPDTAAEISTSSCNFVSNYKAFRAGVQNRSLPDDVHDCEAAKIKINTSIDKTGSCSDGSFDFEERFNFSVPDKFSTDMRRSLSDLIAQEFNKNSTSQCIRDGIVFYLFNSIQSNGYYEYRINLYILRTLALFKQNWSIPQSSPNVFGQISSSDTMRDPIFRYWYMRAKNSKYVNADKMPVTKIK